MECSTFGCFQDKYRCCYIANNCACVLGTCYKVAHDLAQCAVSLDENCISMEEVPPHLGSSCFGWFF
ncbi:conserved hypothetical protein [Ricinus communis]|uniref:Uncharacterized protein n=1 Tax=Ricinus communis TaxID=3988 RepID=B9SPH0_RICCO|nr:conserved hypothetical protein [Ricinus communis]